MPDIRIAGLGEVLWDVLPDGEEIGGAPMNFAYHVNALGARGLPVSTVGDDERGRKALAELGRRGLDVAAISVDPARPTGYVPAQVDARGVARYVFPDDVAWDNLTLNEAALSQAAHLDAVCFGTLAQRSPASRKAIQRFMDAMPEAALKVFDVNLRQTFYSKEIIEASLKRANVLKLSDEELPVLREMFSLEGDEAHVLHALLRRNCLKLAALTRGSGGALLVALDEISEHPGVSAKVADTIGAGDAFTAATVVGLLLDKDLAEINERANALAAYVCSRAGAMPPIPKELKMM
jgi:fructokinase